MNTCQFVCWIPKARNQQCQYQEVLFETNWVNVIVSGKGGGDTVPFLGDLPNIKTFVGL